MNNGLFQPDNTKHVHISIGNTLFQAEPTRMKFDLLRFFVFLFCSPIFAKYILFKKADLGDR